MADRLTRDGAILALEVDHRLAGAHVYDRTWAPPRLGSPLAITGQVRGRLGDEIEAPGVPVVSPLRVGSTLIDVTAAVGPHSLRRG